MLYVNSVQVLRNRTLKSALIGQLIIIIFFSSVSIIYGDWYSAIIFKIGPITFLKDKNEPFIKRLSDHDQVRGCMRVNLFSTNVQKFMVEAITFD